MIRNRFLRPVATLGAATLAAVLATAGLAVAGVNLPDQASKAFEHVGVNLPNQANGGQSGDHARSDEVRSVIEATSPSDRGCEFGHSVAEAAKGEALPEHAQGACDKGHGDEHGKSAAHTNSSSSHSQFGRDTAERAKTLGDATVDQRKSFGKDTSGQAKELGGTNQAPAAEERSENAPTGAPEGTADGPPDTAPVPDDTPTGPPDGTPSGRP